MSDTSIVLSPVEHEAVKEQVSKGKNIIFLRGGSLMININFVKMVVETDSAHDLEQIEVDKKLALEEARKQLP